MQTEFARAQMITQQIRAWDVLDERVQQRILEARQVFRRDLPEEMRGQIEFFDPEHYRSDSNQHWRHGCPHEALARGELEWLQLLTHPEIWAFDGATMRETMESLLDADRAARLEHLRHDRIDLS